VASTRACEAKNRSGERCTAGAQEGSRWCYNHDPERARERKRNAAASGRARSRRPPDELERLKQEVRAVTFGALNGQLYKGVGAVALQGLNTFLRAVEVQRKLDGQRELEDQVAALRVRLHELKARKWAE
jgi:hypothetical protein